MGCAEKPLAIQFEVATGAGFGMIEPTLSAKSAAMLAKYLVQWLHSLAKASTERKRDCLTAIDGVIAAVRRTRAYCRGRDQGHSDFDTEGQLAEMWTRLGFDLNDLGVTKLAKRCDVKGRFWADPKQFSEQWWTQADISLDAVERLARKLHVEIKHAGAPR
jgi:hypothetical protein